MVRWSIGDFQNLLTELDSEQWQEVEARARPVHEWLALDPPLLHLWPLLDAAMYARAVRAVLRAGQSPTHIDAFEVQLRAVGAGHAASQIARDRRAGPDAVHVVGIVAMSLVVLQAIADADPTLVAPAEAIVEPLMTIFAAAAP